MAFYYPDGDGGRRELETGGGTTYIDQTKAGSVIARGTISDAAEFAQVTSKAGELGDGLYMDGDRLCLLPQDDNNEKECSINIKNILKGAGGSSESTDWSGGTSGTTYGIPILSTTPSTVEGAMWLSV